ncbi:MAG TPA: hypothetical protein VGB15_13640 [Longimicrobium sp.]
MTRTPTIFDRLWGGYFAALCAVGAVMLLWTPAGLLREAPFTSLAWLGTLACCGLNAEAMWHRRPRRLRAWSALAIAGFLMAVAHFADRALPGTAAKLDVIVPEPLENLVVASIFFLYFYLRPGRFRQFLRVPTALTPRGRPARAHDLSGTRSAGPDDRIDDRHPPALAACRRVTSRRKTR